MARKKVVKPKPPIPSDVEEFQAQYGPDWVQIIRNPAFVAAMQLLNIRKLKTLTNLSAMEIEKNGRELLSNLVGQLQHEDDLFTLHAKTEGEFPAEEDLVYMSPEEAEEHQKLAAKFAEDRKKKHYGVT